jgi:hypothetical protein
MVRTKRLLAALLATLLITAPAWASSAHDAAQTHDSATAVVSPPGAPAIAPSTAAATPSASPTPELHHGATLSGEHHLVIRDASGRIVAVIDQPNMFTAAGKNYILGAGGAGATVLTPLYLGAIGEASHQAVSSCSSSTLTVPSSVTTTTGQYVTIFGATTVATTISAGAASTTQTIAGSCPSSATVVSFGPVLSSSDTGASHAGWTAFSSSNITNSVWPTWTPGSVSSGSVNNSGSPAQLTMTTGIPTVYLHGVFLTSSSTLSSASGTLIGEVELSGGAATLGANYTITDTYSLTLTRLENELQQFTDWLYDEAA